MTSPTPAPSITRSAEDGISSGGCPVKHSPPPSVKSPWGSWFRSAGTANSSTDNINDDNSKSQGGRSGCPVQNGTVSSIEEAAKHAQTPQPDQRIPLSTQRTISSIPKGTTRNTNDAKASSPTSSSSSSSSSSCDTPNHQPLNNSKWVYPSEQQFFNAMKRKGWTIAPGTESTIPYVVQIHNAVNERGWREIREWESLRCNDSPQLVKFIGRPKDLSPRARILSSLWLRKEPFDRHDWYVSREDGSDVRRYVIDFYNGRDQVVGNNKTDTANVNGDNVNGGNDSGGADQKNLGLPSMYLDVRPALDDVDSVFDRSKMFVKEAFPGISSFLFKR